MKSRKLAATAALTAALGITGQASVSAQTLRPLENNVSSSCTGTDLCATMGTWAIHEAWPIVSARGNFVATNTATATNANCPATVACNSEALAFQIIIDSKATSDYTAGLTNTATATPADTGLNNTQCVGCTAIAIAQQWVLASPWIVTITPAGMAILQQEQYNLASYLTNPNPQTILSALQYFQQDVNQVLSTDVVVTGCSRNACNYWFEWKGAVLP